MRVREFLFLLTIPLSLSVMAAQICSPDIETNTPNKRYMDNSDGTVTDLQTGLMWRKCTYGLSGNGCDQGTLNTTLGRRTNDALGSGEQGFAGYYDWRVPDLAELSSLVSRSCGLPSINENIFPSTASTIYWSSQKFSLFSSNQLAVDFGNGNTTRSLNDYHGHIRLVRTVFVFD